MTPRISIVIPAYNVERFIAEAVASALGQTLEDIEVIVVDDGSTDRSPEIVAAFADPRLRMVRQPNGGLAHARNTGIRHARAGYIGFLDGDDRWHPEKATRHLEVMDADPGIGLTFSHSRYIDEDGQPTGHLLLTAVDRPTLLQLVRRNMIGNGSTPVVRADCFRDAGNFNEAFLSWEDWEMWLRILRDTSYSIVRVPEVLTDYRINTRSLSYDFDRYMENVEAAAAIVKAESPMIPNRCLSSGLAMSYRITGSKAARMGHRRKALEMFTKALKIDPLIAFRDPRFVATLAFMVAPKPAVDAGQRLVGWLAGVRTHRVRRKEGSLQ